VKVLAIIPLRIGSKRLPKKNFLALSGRPLYWWVLREACACRRIDKVVVSTDADRRSLIPENYDIIQRPPELATDTATTEDVVEDVIRKGEYNDYDTIMLIQATTPFTSTDVMDKALRIFEENHLVCLVSVNEQYHPNGAFYIIQREIFFQNKTFWVKGMSIIKMNNRNSLDIDNIWDFRIAEALTNGLIYDSENGK